MVIFDFNDAIVIEDKKYGGSSEKEAIKFNGLQWMLKYPSIVKEAWYDLSYRNNSISEYLSCKIIESIGFEVQSVLLGTKNGKCVVACRDIEEQYNAKLIPLSDFKVSKDRWLNKYDFNRYDVFLRCIANQEYLHQEFIIQNYWNTFVIDALLGNYDRNLTNIGLLVNKDGNGSMSPVYDCASTLAPSLADNRLAEMVSNKRKLDSYIERKPKMSVMLPIAGKYTKLTYLDFIDSTEGSIYLKNALENVLGRISLGSIESIINNLNIISSARKEFYYEFIKRRKEVILDYAYSKFVRVK